MDSQHRIALSASMMCADLLHVARDVEALEAGGIDRFHVDLMDGNYVPNLGLSVDFVGQLAAKATRPIDVHMMVMHPDLFLEPLSKAGASVVTVHPETLGTGVFRTIRRIRDLGMAPGVAVNPLVSAEAIWPLLPEIERVVVMTVDPGFAGQPFLPGMIEKVRRFADARRAHGYHYSLEVDGAIGPDTYEPLLRAGADVLTLGTSSLFGRFPDLADGVRWVRGAVLEALRKHERAAL